MWTKRINRASPEQVFITVRNNDAVTASVGRGVGWDYQVAGTTTAANDGYSVRIPGRSTFTDRAMNPSQLAGVVAGRDILPGIFGSIQIYGEHSAVAVTGYSTDPFHGAASLPLWNDTSIQTIQLRLPNCLIGGLTNNTTVNQGLFAALFAYSQPTTNNVVFSSVAWLQKGGYVVPVDQPIPAGGTTYGTIPATQSGTVKAFIHCLE